MSEPTPGPFCSDDLRVWYYPTDAWSWNEARHNAAEWARTECDPYTVSKHTGTDAYGCHDHEDYEGCERPECMRRAYRIEMVEAAR